MCYYAGIMEKSMRARFLLFRGGFSGGWYQKKHMEPNATPLKANERVIRKH